MTAPTHDLCIERPAREQAVHCRRCPRPLKGARPTIWSHSGLCPEHDHETSEVPATSDDDRDPAPGSSRRASDPPPVHGNFAPGSPPAAAAPIQDRPPYAGRPDGTPTVGAGCGSPSPCP